jgi:hypothetical protein
MAPEQKPRRDSAGFIYILKPLISIEGKNVIKIGMTTRTVAQRVRELTTGSMVPFEIVYSLRVENAPHLEKRLHNRFRSRRLAGGGEEFFDVSSDDVIAEIEKIATDVSRTRAQKALVSELQTFMTDIGASHLQSRIEIYFLIVCAPCWLLFVFGTFKIAHALWGNGYDVIVAVANLFFFPPMLIACGSRLHRRVMNRYFEPQYRTSIEEKRRELLQKYPLANT